jgi:hypothetical protein
MHLKGFMPIASITLSFLLPVFHVPRMCADRGKFYIAQISTFDASPLPIANSLWFGRKIPLQLACFLGLSLIATIISTPWLIFTYYSSVYSLYTSFDPVFKS